MPTFHNKTRRAASIPRKLIRNKKFHLLPLYYLLRTSELGREGIDNSGSYHFADHIYRNKPKGKFIIGYIIDALLLRLKSARSFRTRYLSAKKEIRKVLDTDRTPMKILIVPCGLARELFEIEDERKALPPKEPLQGVEWYGLDLDPVLIKNVRERAHEYSEVKAHFQVGDALDEQAYFTEVKYDMVISTGFTEFLNDDDVVRFYALVLRKLDRSGVFFTSGMMPHKISEYLMRHIAELDTHYRSESKLRELARTAGFHSIKTYHDKTGLQTMLIAADS